MAYIKANLGGGSVNREYIYDTGVFSKSYTVDPNATLTTNATNFKLQTNYAGTPSENVGITFSDVDFNNKSKVIIEFAASSGSGFQVGNGQNSNRYAFKITAIGNNTVANGLIENFGADWVKITDGFIFGCDISNAGGTGTLKIGLILINYNSEIDVKAIYLE